MIESVGRALASVMYIGTGTPNFEAVRTGPKLASVRYYVNV